MAWPISLQTYGLHNWPLPLPHVLHFLLLQRVSREAEDYPAALLRQRRHPCQYGLFCEGGSKNFHINYQRKRIDRKSSIRFNIRYDFCLKPERSMILDPKSKRPPVQKTFFKHINLYADNQLSYLI